MNTSSRNTSTRHSGSELDRIIPPEIKNDAFYRIIRNLAAQKDVVHILEIGSSAGQGSTAAFVEALRGREGQRHLYCLEISGPRFNKLQDCYQNDAFVHCHQWSSVDTSGFASSADVRTFFDQTPSGLNQYPIDRVLGWLQQDIDYIRGHRVDGSGIERIKKQYRIDRFDMVLIDGSEFTGQAELELVYGAKYILLDDTNSFKNHANFHRLKNDPAYELVEAQKRLRNGYAVFKKREPVLPIHFFTIVLNGMPFIRYHIEVLKKLNMPWHWHLIEGVASHTHDTSWGKSNGGHIPGAFHHNGLSVDGTTVYLDALKAEFPDNISIYRPAAGRFWDGKLAMVSAPLPQLPEGCLLWQVDADELWTVDQIQHMHQMFTDHPERTAAHFHCHFFVGPDLVTITPKAYSHNDGYEWFRVWRYRRGMRWQSHEPPRLMASHNDQWQDVARIRPFTHAETEAAGLVFTHCAYVTEEQVRFKEAYYGYTGAVNQWHRLQAAPEYPARLGKYLAWVKDHAQADHVARARIGSHVPPVAWDAQAPVQSSENKEKHIVIDGVIFQLQHQRPLGIARVWQNLLPELKRAMPDAKITVLTRKGFPVPVPGISSVEIPPYVMGDEKALDNDDDMLRQTCLELNADLFISTYFTRAPGLPNIVLVHDLIPELFNFDLGQPEWQAKIRTLETGDGFAAVSDTTLQDLQQHYPRTALSPVQTVPNGIDAPFGPRDADQIAAFKDTYGLNRPYVLMVGNRHLYKNSALLFQCTSHNQWPADLQIVCVGGESRRTPLEKNAEASGRARFISRLDDEALSAAYAGARALVCLSEYEGFGLPVLEAMACGCPVITTPNGALKEVAGQAALFVDGHKKEQLLEALAQAVQPDRRNQMAELGLRRAQRFTWPDAAKKMARLIGQLEQRPPVMVSAIVSAYNSERFIKGCLEDLLSQSISDHVEIIVIDSGSPQNEQAVVRDFQRRCGGIKYHRTQSRESVYAAWNRGIKLAQGKYVTNANTDDRHRHTAFEEMVSVLEAEPHIALVYADVIQTATENETFSQCTPTGMLSWYDWERERMLSKGCFVGPQPMWRRQVHEFYGFFDETYTVSSDYEFWLRISQTFDFNRIAKPLGLYLERPDSVEHADRAHKRNEDNAVHEKYLRLRDEQRITGYKPFEKLRSGRIDHQRQGLADILRMVQAGIFPSSGQLSEKMSQMCLGVASQLEKGNLDNTIVENFIHNISSLIIARHGQPPAGDRVKQRVSNDRSTIETKDTNERHSHLRGGPNMQSADTIYQGIQFLIKSGHVDIAQWALEKFVADFPGNPQAHHELAVLAHGRNDAQQAAHHFKLAAQLAPFDATIQKSLGDFYHVVLGRTEEAVGQYEKVLSSDPNHVETLLTLAHLHVSLRRLDQAETYYEKVLSVDPNQTDAHQMLERLRAHTQRQPVAPAPAMSVDEQYRKATGEIQSGRPRDAIATLEALLATSPGHALAHNDLGVLYYEAGDKQQALVHYERAAELAPENNTFQKNLADFYYVEQGDIQQALKKYVQALTLDPQDVDCLMACGHICMAIEQKEDARVFINRILEIDPLHLQARDMLSQLDHIGRATVSNQTNDQMTFRTPPPATARPDGEELYETAQNKAVAGDIPGATAVLNQLISQEPNHAVAHNDLGVLYYEQGDKNSALHHYELAVQIAPHNATFMKNLADFYFVEQGRVQEALSIYVKLLEADREDIDALIAAGIVCVTLEQDEDARVFFERVLEIDPWNDKAREELDRIDNVGQKKMASGQ